MIVKLARRAASLSPLLLASFALVFASWRTFPPHIVVAPSIWRCQVGRKVDVRHHTVRIEVWVWPVFGETHVSITIEGPSGLNRHAEVPR